MIDEPTPLPPCKVVVQHLCVCECYPRAPVAVTAEVAGAKIIVGAKCKTCGKDYEQGLATIRYRDFGGMATILDGPGGY